MGKRRVVDAKGEGLLTESGAVAAAGAPLFTIQRIAAVCRVHKLRVKGQHRFDLLLLQPLDEAVNIHEIAVDAVKMHDIRLFFSNNSHELTGGQVTSAVHQTGNAAAEVVQLSVQLAADLIGVLFRRFDAAAVVDTGGNALPLQSMVDVPHDLAGASVAVNTVDLKYFHTPSAIRFTMACSFSLFALDS